MIKIPYGISGFERIRKQGYKYIDKTRYIREIEEEPYCMYVRPRRFGKTLFTICCTKLCIIYLNKKDDKKEKIEKAKSEAREQIKNYMKDERLQANKNLKNI